MAVKPSLADFSPVFDTEEAADVKRVLEALDGRRIPSYGRQLGPGEVKLDPMPPAPKNGPDIIWEVMVPQWFHPRARAVIRRLPLTHAPAPGTLRDAPDTVARSTRGIGKWILLILLAAAAIRQLSRFL